MTSWPKIRVLRGKMGERVVRCCLPNELVFTFEGSYVYANFGENPSRNATVRVLADRHADRQTHRQTDWLTQNTSLSSSKQTVWPTQLHKLKFIDLSQATFSSHVVMRGIYYLTLNMLRFCKLATEIRVYIWPADFSPRWLLVWVGHWQRSRIEASRLVDAR